MSGVVEWLELLNRKERHWLLKDALGGFSMAQESREKLSGAIDQHIPATARLWMDYPFDWIYAALQLAGMDPGSVAGKVFVSPNFASGLGGPPIYVNANQEDVDLLVAYEENGVTHLVLVEAKGASSWANRQLRSKVHRMNIIFDTTASWFRDDVVPHFVITSPRESERLEIEEWFPPWVISKGRLSWMLLPQPTDTARIQRCDPTTGKPAKATMYWRIERC